MSKSVVYLVLGFLAAAVYGAVAFTLGTSLPNCMASEDTVLCYWGQGATGVSRIIPVNTTLAVEYEVLMAGGAWYRVGEALDYLRSMGYNVAMADLGNLTMLVAVKYRFYEPVWNGSRVVLVEKAVRAHPEYIVVLGVARDGSLYALKLRGKPDDPSSVIVGASRVRLVPGEVIENTTVLLNCTGLDTIVARYGLNYTVEELVAEGVPGTLCGVEEIVVYRARYVFEDPSLAVLGPGVEGVDSDAASALSELAPPVVVSRMVGLMGGVVRAEARMVVWALNGVVHAVRDEGGCGVAWWAGLLGHWELEECTHTSYAGAGEAHAECRARVVWLPRGGLAGGVRYCVSVSVGLVFDGDSYGVVGGGGVQSC